MAQGYSFLPAIERRTMDQFKLKVEERCLLGREGLITGEYLMQQVDPTKLHHFPETNDVVDPILKLAKSVLGAYLKRQELEVFIHSSAILTSPKTNHNQRQQNQVMHVDHLGFTALTAVIMLTEEGGYSTYLSDQRNYGRDTHKERDLLLNFDVDQLDRDTDENQRIRNAISDRYGSLLEQSPDNFFNGAHSQFMAYGEIVIFRPDLLHAGPFSSHTRKVLFLEIRVRGESLPKDDQQLRFPNLMEITGKYSEQEIQDFRNVWESQGYLFPHEPETQEPEEETPVATKQKATPVATPKKKATPGAIPKRNTTKRKR